MAKRHCSIRGSVEREQPAVGLKQLDQADDAAANAVLLIAEFRATGADPPAGLLVPSAPVGDVNSEVGGERRPFFFLSASLVCRRFRTTCITFRHGSGSSCARPTRSSILFDPGTILEIIQPHCVLNRTPDVGTRIGSYIREQKSYFESFFAIFAY